MVQVQTTSGFDRIVRFIQMLTGMLLFFAAWGLVLELLLPLWDHWVMGVAGFIVGLFVWAKSLVVLSEHVFTPLSAFLYVRLSLRTPIRFAEAKPIAWLFVPNETGKWYPMRFLRSLPREQRRAALFHAVAEIEGSPYLP